MVEAMIRQGAMAADDDVFPMSQGSDLAGRVQVLGREVTRWRLGVGALWLDRANDYRA